ncbi:MAG: hypothetical protein GF400_06025 [Candidatus Eisenbacteria bacterium]|nr:hypothetical protein [Candidatus Eisenbacteria bacterium]
MSEQPSRALPAGTSDFYCSLVDRCVGDLIETLGRDVLDAVLLIGAPARGEATVVSTSAGLYSLSDVDLACIAGTGTDLRQLRDRLAAWVTDVNTRVSSECTGVDASVKPRRGEGAIRPLISTYEMLRSPVVVWGDQSVVDDLPAVRLEDVPAWDSLVLFHNRTVEQVLATPTLVRGGGGAETPDFEREAYRLLYTAGKYLLDAVTALLFLHGEVPDTYADRAVLFRGRFLASADGEALRRRMEKHVDDVGMWAEFKASGDVEALRSLSDPEGRGPTGATERRRPADVMKLARACHLRYADCADALWRAVLGRTLGERTYGLPLSDVAALYSRLESPGKKIGRTLKTLRSPAGRAGLFPVFRALRLAPFASPRQLSYLTAVLAYMSLSERAPDAEISALLSRFCPFRTPCGFASLPLAKKTDVLTGELAVFHASVLRGREIPRKP